MHHLIDEKFLKCEKQFHFFLTRFSASYRLMMNYCFYKMYIDINSSFTFYSNRCRLISKERYSQWYAWWMLVMDIRFSMIITINKWTIQHLYLKCCLYILNEIWIIFLLIISLLLALFWFTMCYTQHRCFFWRGIYLVIDLDMNKALIH